MAGPTAGVPPPFAGSAPAAGRHRLGRDGNSGFTELSSENRSAFGERLGLGLDVVQDRGGVVTLDCEPMFCWT